MSNQNHLPQFFQRLLRSSLCIFIVFGYSLAMAAAGSDACALLKPADLSTLLGGAPVATPNGGACNWTGAIGGRKLIVAKMNATGPAAEMAFMGAHMGAAKGGSVVVTDEAGLGDKAFASRESFGIALIMLKQGRLLQLQYWSGGAGTAKDLDALRPIAKKAISAF